MLICVMGTAALTQSEETVINQQKCKDFNFEITESAIWQIALHQKTQPLVSIDRPALYEVCADEKVSERIRIITAHGYPPSMTISPASCALVWSNHIGIVLDGAASPGDVVKGTYRRLDERESPTFSHILDFKTQVDLSMRHVVNYIVAKIEPIEVNATYRFCQPDDSSRRKLSRDYLTGINIWIDGAAVHRHQEEPLQAGEEKPAVFGPGSCIDLEGSSLIIQAKLHDNKTKYDACAKISVELSK